jgi:hypothetical protein
LSREFGEHREDGTYVLWPDDDEDADEFNYEEDLPEQNYPQHISPGIIGQATFGSSHQQPAKDQGMQGVQSFEDPSDDAVITR